MKKFSISSITTPYRTNIIISIYKKWFKRKGKVLDVGCGTGIVTKLLQKELDLNITGCDVKNYLVHNIKFVKIEDDKLPFPTNSFDVVLFNDVLHHIDKSKQARVIKEALRVGKNVFIFEFEPSLSGKIFDIMLNKLHYDNLAVPLSFRHIQEWQELFTKLSANCDYIRLKRPFWYPFTHIAFRISKIR